MKKIISIILSLLLIISTLSSVYAGSAANEQAQEEPNTLTVTKATELAIANSSAIKRLYESIDLTSKERLQQIEDHSSLYIPEEDEITFVDSNTSLTSLLRIITLEITNQSNELDMKLQKEKIEQSIRNLFLSILNVEKDIILQKLSIEQSSRQLKISEKKLELGMMANADYLTEKLDFEKKLITLQEREISLDKTYTSLNMLMGVSAGEKYELVLDLEYKPMEQIDLEKYIIEKQSTDPNIAKKDKDLTNAKYQLNIYTTTGNSSYDSRRTNYSQAVRAVEDAKLSLEETIRNLYNDIKNLELTISGNEIELEKNIAQLKIKEVQFDLGLITELELITLKNRIYELEQTIERNKLDHAMNMLKFEKPYLVG